MGVPVAEFRRLNISESEPADRTTAGEVVSTENLLELGNANNSSGSVQLGPFCLIFRVNDMNGNTKVEDMEFAITAISDLEADNKFYVKITDTWVQNITFEEVAAGPPGILKKGFTSESNLQKIGGGPIEGTDHNNTSQYIYIAVLISENEPVGENKGENGTLKFGVKANYYV